MGVIEGVADCLGLVGAVLPFPRAAGARAAVDVAADALAGGVPARVWAAAVEVRCNTGGLADIGGCGRVADSGAERVRGGG
ncbi:hypothetical protein A2J04_22715 [Rhodococcus sp. EPR-279]|nr:hypothetical protein A2J02_22185 [Rhodococcus sp. EPR-147]KZF08966.1 hypothetical protein A2J04_22715 [Rhodococcus sp. EPR-279]